MTREEEIQKAVQSFCDKVCPCLLVGEYSFIQGAKWADANPKSPWIDTEVDLPYKHDSLLIKCLPYNSKLTKSVLTLVDDGSCQVCDMFVNEEGKWEWSYNGTVLYWMPIPKLEEE